MANLYSAVLTKRNDISNGLAIFNFRVNPVFNFKPGQYVTLSYSEDGKKILRPYSVASSPSQIPELELFIRLVNFNGKLGDFTGKLFNCNPGCELKIVKIGGAFLLDENDKRKKIFVGSGTGIAPYMSMIRDYTEKNKKSDFVVLHGVSYVEDLGYRKELAAYERQGNILKYIPTISRPGENPSWKGETGRAEKLISSGRLEEILGEKLNPEKHVFYLCGHPHMIEDAAEFLKTKGFEEKKDIKFEKYWSAPRKK